MRRGFTLIELLIIIAITGLLATFVFVVLNNTRLKKCADGDKEACITLELLPSEALEKLNEGIDEDEEESNTEFLDRLNADLGRVPSGFDSSSQYSIENWYEGVHVRDQFNEYEVTRLKKRVNGVVIELERITE